MSKGRLEAFSDGVLAIILTIMVLELKVPQGADLSAVRSLVSVFLSYLLSFIYVGIYWNNHHHLLQAADHVDGRVLWANLHLLFWLSLIPFVTRWAEETEFAAWPVAAYGLVLLMSGCAYAILTRALVAGHGVDSTLAKAVGADRKAMVSMMVYAVAMVLALYKPWVSCAVYAGVACLWLIPDPRIERKLKADDATQ